jgi:Domain of unknown function (DUF4351)
MAVSKNAEKWLFCFIAEKFTRAPPEIISRVEALNVEQFQSLATSVFRFSSIDDLSNWLDHV